MHVPQARLPIQTQPCRHPWLATLLGIAIVAAACTSPEVKKQRYLESGNQYFDKAQFAEAIIEYRNAIAVDATFGPARKRLAESYLRTGNARGSFDEFIRAADMLPTDVDVQLTAGNLRLMAKQPQEALARADAALKVQPENIDALVLRGNALAGLTSFDEALESIEQAIKLDPDRGTTYTSLGLVQVRQGQRDDAEATLRRAVSLSPKEVKTHLALGNFYWSVGRTKEAEQAFDAALTVEPANLEANRFMASFKFATGQRPEAEPYFRRIADGSEGPEGTVALADYYLLTARPKDAIASLERLKTGREVPAVMLRLARAQAAAGELAKAHSLVDQVLKTNDKYAPAQLLKGELLLQEGRREDAFAAIQTATTLAPTSADAQFALGRMYASRGDVAAAQAAFQEVLRINPRATAAQVQLARLQAQRKPEESVRTAEEATRNDPTSLAARLTLLQSLTAARDFGRAEREMTKLRAEYPNEAAVHTQDARLALAKKDVAGARAALQRAEKLDPASIDTLSVFIALEVIQNNAPAARARLEARLKQRTSPDLLLLAGRTYLALGDLAAAEKVLREAVVADPSRNEPYGMLGSIYLNQNKLDEALREYEALSKKQAKPVGALTMTGMILVQQGKKDLAKKRYEEVLALDGSAAVAGNNLAWILADSGEDLDRALDLAKAAVAAVPDKPEMMDTLGWVYYKKQQPLMAIPQFQRSSELNPTNGVYHYHLGLAHNMAGDSARARSAFQQALRAGTDANTAAEIKSLLAKAGAAQ
jgi:tetratricopeptide (TPR) repeat protein